MTAWIECMYCRGTGTQKGLRCGPCAGKGMRVSEQVRPHPEPPSNVIAIPSRAQSMAFRAAWEADHVRALIQAAMDAFLALDDLCPLPEDDELAAKAALACAAARDKLAALLIVTGP